MRRARPRTVRADLKAVAGAAGRTAPVSAVAVAVGVAETIIAVRAVVAAVMGVRSRVGALSAPTTKIDRGLIEN